LVRSQFVVTVPAGPVPATATVPFTVSPLR
jgi:hypothetical protein